ncbi:tol-pal system-associated acyl-CoA thioesterase [Propylenella binzhouense]|uniref:Tol-pal system-associated acyl-CoA thioesterase n=1 Tax=Propylenella binzhouense TaxID=2555902 RepID=A0A964WTL6_9HYPH|nr:tol-pal system-associated acyl-CoA thioesterase [Propylenella binzhouense]MYZ48124.1 tol-pal system-associated acyl-CoA thioesterase [Propylenella binzhouense]
MEEDPGDALAGRLTAGGHELRQRVYFEDTDFTGLVYHARYLHFMERGRSDYLRLLGIRHLDLAADGIAFVVRRMEIDFMRPARIDDVLTIRTGPRGCSGARLELAQSVLGEGNRVLVSARLVLALIGAAGRPVRLPPALRAAFTAAPSPDRADAGSTAERSA